MTERYVRPPLVAQEPAPVWRAVWRFRLLGFVLLALLVLVGVLLFRSFTGATAQDPGLDALGTLIS